MSDYAELNIQINDLLEKSRRLIIAGWYGEGRDAAMVAAVHIAFAYVAASLRGIDPIIEESKDT